MVLLLWKLRSASHSCSQLMPAQYLVLWQRRHSCGRSPRPEGSVYDPLLPTSRIRSWYEPGGACSCFTGKPAHVAVLLLLILDQQSGAEDTGRSGAVVAGADAEKGNKLWVMCYFSSLKGPGQLQGAKYKSALRNSLLKQLGWSTQRSICSAHG